MDRTTLARKYVIIEIILLFVGTCIIPAIAQNTEKSSTSRGNWLYVGGSGPGNYTKIQDAIDNASEGDTVFVYSGVYLENLNIEKDSISLVGENKYTTILDGNKKDDVLRIFGNYTSIKEFTIQNSSDLHVGIAVQILMYPSFNIRNIDVSDCIIKNNDRGILFNNVSYSSIQNCQLYNLTAQSITIRLLSENISITNCTIHDSGKDFGGGVISSGNILIDGWTLDEWNRDNCSNITIYNNDIYYLLGNGITITKSKNVHISHNNIYENSLAGIDIGASYNCEIYRNNIYENKEIGIFIMEGNVKIFNNSIYINGVGGLYNGGILLQDCLNNITITDNDIRENNQYGLYLIRSSINSIIKNNFINNTINAYFLHRAFFNHWSENYWDRPRILPYPIFGIVWGPLNKFKIPWVNFDWHPAQEPYDIPGMS